jgi:flagellar motor switch protein FliG
MAEAQKNLIAPLVEGVPLSGRHKAAILMLAIPDDYVAKIFGKLDEIEVLELSQLMANLGSVSAERVEQVFIEFVEKTGSSAMVTGSLSTTEMLLSKVFSADKVAQIMEELRGPAGRTMWDKLNNVDEKSLASYLRNEHPQTAAVILSRLKPDHVAKVLTLLTDEFALNIMTRILRMENVQRDVLQNIEDTLRSEFIANFARTSQKDAHEKLAEVFNFFDRTTETRFMDQLERLNRESAEKIRSLMFTFVDMIKLDSAGVQTLLRVVDKTRLALALKGANENIKTLFLNNMSERAAKLLREDMEGMGMVRLRDVEEAQMDVVNQAKMLADKGEIIIHLAESEDEQLIA